MDKRIYEAYIAILRDELVPALGCTEPIAIAYAAAKAAEVLGERPEKLTVQCSGNIIKNAKSVTVPNSGGMQGLEAAASLGALGGDASRGLEVLQAVRPEHQAEAKDFIAEKRCAGALAEGKPNLYIHLTAEANGHSAAVEITGAHTHITRIERGGEVLFSQEGQSGAREGAPDKGLLNVRDILDFADNVAPGDLGETITRQIEYNSAISAAGLAGGYGAEIGRTLLEGYDSGDVRIRARAAAAAGSDARMGGCPLPVVINSGSGNQGMTVSLPVIEYARSVEATGEQLIRALVVSNLIALLQKRSIGNLSAYCGAVSAGTGAVCGILYLQGAGYDVIARTITNSLANIGGMVCDGAKPSCAAKISSALETAFLAAEMSRKERVFRPGDGIVKGDVEQTIESVGRMAREGMRGTDVEILRIMMEPIG